MHQFFRRHDARAENFADGLMPQANAENRNLAAEALDCGFRHAAVVGAAGAGRDDNRPRPRRRDSRRVDFVVAPHFDRRAQFAQKLEQIVGEGIVVVDQQNHRPPSAAAAALARRAASITARALFTLSQYSLAGSESATTPPPA